MWPLHLPRSGGKGIIYVVADRSPDFCRLLLIFPKHHKTRDVLNLLHGDELNLKLLYGTQISFFFSFTQLQ